MKHLSVWLLAVFLAGCATPEEKVAREQKNAREIAQCKATGSRVVLSWGRLSHCVSPEQDARSLQLASACMAGGNIPDMHPYSDVFRECKAPVQQVPLFTPIDYSSVTESIEATQRAISERRRTHVQRRTPVQTTCRSNSDGTVNCTSY